MIFLVCVGSQTGAAQTSKSALYLDPSQPINVRVDDLVGR